MNLAAAFLDRSRHHLAREYPTKIERCLATLPSDALWRRADRDSNSIANLLLHLEGNIRQWIVASVGGADDHRHRAAEFAAVDGANAATLFAALRATLDQADGVIAGLTESDLATRRTIQGRDVTVFDAIYHVVEHCAMHTGQIILLTKQFAPGTVQFYEDAGGLATPTYDV